MEETIKYKIRRIRVKAAVVLDGTDKERTKLLMDEIIEVCKDALKAMDEVAEGADKIKDLIR